MRRILIYVCALVVLLAVASDADACGRRHRASGCQSAPAYALPAAPPQYAPQFGPFVPGYVLPSAPGYQQACPGGVCPAPAQPRRGLFR
jgi:hypothetical protein